MLSLADDKIQLITYVIFPQFVRIISLIILVSLYVKRDIRPYKAAARYISQHKISVTATGGSLVREKSN